LPVSVPPGPSSEGQLAENQTARRRPLAWRVAGLLLLFLAAYLIGNFIDVWLASRADYADISLGADTTRAAVVLGAAQYNGSPSPVLRGRLDRAAHLYQTDQVNLVVVTGGRQPADVTTEAKSGYDYLREQTGIPDAQLRLEVQGGSTYESLAATARFLHREEVTEVVLVTDRFHAKRSILVAREVGLDPVVALTDPPPSLRRLVQETGAVAVGRLITFRRLEAL
jgi:vancomycin permeability regulator SanA